MNNTWGRCSFEIGGVNEFSYKHEQIPKKPKTRVVEKTKKVTQHYFIGQ